MFVLACLRHWYESLIFFGPIPVVGIWVWLSGRRQSEQAPGRMIGPESRDASRGV